MPDPTPIANAGPHLRHFQRARQSLCDASALAVTWTTYGHHHIRVTAGGLNSPYISHQTFDVTRAGFSPAERVPYRALLIDNGRYHLLLAPGGEWWPSPSPYSSWDDVLRALPNSHGLAPADTETPTLLLPASALTHLQTRVTAWPLGIPWPNTDLLYVAFRRPRLVRYASDGHPIFADAEPASLPTPTIPDLSHP